MAEYTYKDVIIDPEDPRVEIGKEYFFGDCPSSLLWGARTGWEAMALDRVCKDAPSEDPFYNGSARFQCIIRKKEAKKKYVPFDFDKPEVRRELMGKTIINKYGLDGDGEFREVMIVGFMNKSDEDRDCWSSNGDTKGTIAMTVEGYFHADELLKECTFLDGSPCGKLVEVEE